MAELDGAWDCTVKSPMGEQKFVLTVKSDGDRFTGSNAGDIGSVDITDGRVEGDTLRWSMDVKSPFPMTLNGEATVAGDTIDGKVTAGAFGSFPLTGTRKG